MTLDKGFIGLRTGRASPGLVEAIKVDVHGSFLALYQILTISISNNNTLSVRLWDQNAIKKAEKAIIDSNLGVLFLSKMT